MSSIANQSRWPLLWIGLMLGLTLGWRFTLTPSLHLPAFMGVYLSMAITLWMTGHQLSSSDQASTNFIWWLPLSAVGLRLLLLTTEPILSNDAFRYLWDGQLIWHGLNPLQLSPAEASQMLSHGMLNLPPDHQDTASVYPLVAQAYFALGFLIHPTPWVFGVFAAILDGLSTFLLLKILLRQERPPAWALLFAWHPLSMVESGHSGHVDALGIFLLVLGLYALPRLNRAGISLALAGLTKLWPIVFLTLFLRRKYWRGFGVGVAVFALGFAVLWHDPHHFSGLGAYLEHWEFHGALYSMLRLHFSNLAARWICLGAFVLCVAWILLPSGKRKWEEQGTLITAALLYCAPTVHPWYAVWLLPFLVLRPQLPWIYLSLAIVSAYAVLPNYLEHHIWKEGLWARWMTYVPPLILVIWQRIRLARKVDTVT